MKFNTPARLALSLALAAFPALAQSPEKQTGDAAGKTPSTEKAPLDACGPRSHIKFSVHVDKNQHSLPDAPQDKAMVVVIQQVWTAMVKWQARSDTTALAVDGKWVGANRGSSYFFFPIEPGEHHACSFAWVGRIQYGDTRILLHSLNAEAGKTYYFVQKQAPVDLLGHTISMAFDQVDAEQAMPLLKDVGLATTEIH